MKEILVKSGKKIWQHKVMVFFLILIIGIGVYFFGYQKNTNEKSFENNQVVTAKRGDISVSVTGTGQIYAKSQVDLKGVVAGDGIDVIEVAVRDDQEVREGELIAILDTTEPMKKVRDAKLDLEASLISQKQTIRLNDNETVEDKWTRQSQEISVQQKKNSFSDANDKLENYYIKAPFDGIVTGLSVGVGDSVSQSDVIASVITKEMYAQISLNEVDAVRVKEGNEVKLTLDALPEAEIKGKVSKIDTIGEVSQNVVSYNARIEFESINESLKPGMSVDAEILVESKKNVVYVPVSVVKTADDGTFYVEMMSGKKNFNEGSQLIAKNSRQKVEIGISDDLVTEIKSGLKEGDSVVLKKTTAVDSSREKSSGFNLFGIGGSPRGMQRK